MNIKLQVKLIIEIYSNVMIVWGKVLITKIIGWELIVIITIFNLIIKKKNWNIFIILLESNH